MRMDDVDDVIDDLAEPEEDEEEKPGVIDSVRSLDADAILDTLVPRSIDWRDTVRRHPVGAVAVVGLVGYLVGRTKGAAIMAGITGHGDDAPAADVFDGDFFDF
jgi:hypothetical protein